MINSKEELHEVIELEKKLWIRSNYPNGAPKRVKSRELEFVQALRYMEYCSGMSGLGKILKGGGKIPILEI